MAEEPNETQQHGTEFSKIPCFRQTFLYSIGSGLGAGLLHFMLTSNVPRSGHIAMGTYGCVTLGYWSYCRYNYSKEKFNMKQVQAGMRNRASFEGTEIDKEVKQEE